MESDRVQMPDSIQPRPEYFFCLYLYQGKLMVAMAMKKQNAATATVEKLESQGTSYNDLEWHEVRAIQQLMYTSLSERRDVL